MAILNIPAIRGVLGGIIYYTSSFTFKQIATLVSPINDELHTSTSLKDQLQRSLTENHKSITSYILSQKEHFFNALVLAVYDGDPIWNEIEVGFNGEDYYNMGFLRLSGEEKIFPVDGQHRVEGIRSAIKEDTNLEDETIAVILIGHQKNKEGMEKTRRIFSTLNRYAKPVSTGDIIALDEDDVVAIVTRDLLETFPLFLNDKVGAAKSSKALSKDVKSFTSLITLYETNKIIYRYYISKTKKKLYSKSQIAEFLKIRPDQSKIDEFKNYLVEFWNLFCDLFYGMREYILSTDKNAAEKYRNRENGGLMYFRPVALPELVIAILETVFREKISLKESMTAYSKMEMWISKDPWAKVIWDVDKHVMITSNSTLVHLILMYMYDDNMLKDSELLNLKRRYAKVIGIDAEKIDVQLSSLR
jgi:DNA sulfur modification protein DndB